MESQTTEYNMTNSETQFILYQLPEEEGVIQVVVKDETIWATQKAMAQLFGVDKSGISRHIANVFKEGELKQEMTVAKIATVIHRDKRGEVEELIDYYNLDMIISIGYRVNSAKKIPAAYIEPSGKRFS